MGRCLILYREKTIKLKVHRNANVSHLCGDYLHIGDQTEEEREEETRDREDDKGGCQSPIHYTYIV